MLRQSANTISMGFLLPRERTLASIHRLSTADVAPSERLAFWNDLFTSSYRPMVIDAEPEGFEGVLTRLTASGLEITSVKSTPLITRTAASTTIGRPGGEPFSLQIVYSGRCHLRLGNLETAATMGDILVVDSSKRYELAFSVPVQGLVLFPPPARFKGYAERFEAIAGHRINVIRGPGAVLSTFVRCAWEQMVERGEGEWLDSAGEVIWDLLASILDGETAHEIGSGRAEELRRRAQTVVDGELGNPAFTGTALAEALGISARYLQRVFAETGTTPSRFLIARRLDAAAALLRRLDRPCSITDVALQCGFSDLSYFSHAFRRRFGLPPRSFRLSSGADGTG